MPRTPVFPKLRVEDFRVQLKASDLAPIPLYFRQISYSVCQQPFLLLRWAPAHALLIHMNEFATRMMATCLLKMLPTHALLRPEVALAGFSGAVTASLALLRPLETGVVTVPIFPSVTIPIRAGARAAECTRGLSAAIWLLPHLRREVLRC